MIEPPDLRLTRMPLNHGTGHMPALGISALIPDAAVTISATRDVTETGLRRFDCTVRYRNEQEIDEASRAGLAAGGMMN